MVTATVRDLDRAGGTQRPGIVLADAGYWHKKQMEEIVADGIQVLVPPDSGLRVGARPGWEGGLYDFMRRVLATEHGQALYAKRKQSIEPVTSPAYTVSRTPSAGSESMSERHPEDVRG
jgi:hypothetical protein